MTIITKPSTITKNEVAEFTLNKTALSNHASVVGNAYFHDTTNWKEVIIKFTSTVGNQTEILVFDATKTTPTASFLVSDKARDVFEGDHITILDHDGGSFTIQKADLSSEFVIDMSVVVPSGVSINWDITNSNYQEELDGGVTSSRAGNGFDLLYGDTVATGDFVYTYNFSGATPVDDLIIAATSWPTTATYGIYMDVEIKSYINNIDVTNTPIQSRTFLPENTFIIRRVGDILTLELNGIVLSTANVAGKSFKPALNTFSSYPISSAFVVTPSAQQPAVLNGLVWTPFTNYTLTANGGLISSNTDFAQSGTTIISDDTGISTATDFELIYNINSTRVIMENETYIGFSNSEKTLFDGLFSRYDENLPLFDNQTTRYTHNTPLTIGNNEVKFVKIGSTVTMVINGNNVFSASISGFGASIRPAVRFFTDVTLVSSTLV